MSSLRAVAALLLLTLTSGCGAAQQSAAPTTAPTAAPSPTRPPQPSVTTATAQASPTAAPSAPPAPTASAAPSAGPTVALAGPTAEPGPAGLLPAPLYLIDDETQQVVRLEIDGKTATQITFEAAPVLELAIAAETGTLAYIVGEPEGTERTLVLLDGGGRRERLYANISSLAISPDGQQVIYRLDEPEPGLIIGQEESPSGVWLSLPYGPGRPSLVQADEPANGEYDDAAPAWRYSPIAFSPDGVSLALYAYDADGPALPGGEIVIRSLGLDKVVRGPTCCELPVWSDDGATLFSAGGGPGPDLRYGLYRLDAGTGAETPVVEPPEGVVPLVTLPHQPAGGDLYAFVEMAPMERFSWEHPFQPRIARVGADGAITPISRPVDWPAVAVWDEAGRGAVAAPSTPEGALLPLVWVPAADAPTVALGRTGTPIAWATTPLTAGDCTIFEPVTYQDPAGRRQDAGVQDIQARLGALGFDAGPADGLYGDQTRDAVSAFQEQRGLPASGDVDCATWQALLGGPVASS